ncbi:MAG: HNH endonuclease [bacterium]
MLPEMPLSIATAPPAPGRKPPYEDAIDGAGQLNYRYRGTDPDHRDNRALRLAMKNRVPLIYMFGVSAGEYLPVYPAFVAGDDPWGLTFKVSFDESRLAAADGAYEQPHAVDARRAYITRVTVQRLHQAAFRDRVLRAYLERCAVCRLRHKELLDAAHIVPDSRPAGDPVVPNGLALCKLHHAAFDKHILGIRPDLVIEIRREILEEHDGPMLRHGLQALQGQSLAALPRQPLLQPGRRYLEERYDMFRRAG